MENKPYDTLINKAQENIRELEIEISNINELNYPLFLFISTLKLLRLEQCAFLPAIQNQDLIDRIRLDMNSWKSKLTSALATLTIGDNFDNSHFNKIKQIVISINVMEGNLNRKDPKYVFKNPSVYQRNSQFSRQNWRELDW